MKLNKIIILLLLFSQLSFLNIAIARSSEVTFVDVDGQSSNEMANIQSACDLLGVKLKTHLVGKKSSENIRKSIEALRNSETLILSDKMLKYYNGSIVSLLGKQSKRPNILILGITHYTDINGLKILSDNKIKSIRQVDCSSVSSLMSIKVVKNDQISRELGGLEYPLSDITSTNINGIQLEDANETTSLIDVIDKTGKSSFPIFVQIYSARKNVFFLTSWEKVMPQHTNGPLRIMPLLMFLKHAFGDRAWHSVSDYANVIIDDPWLREPYGYINFKELCKNAKQASFHVTIGFIPYNYEKSHADVIDVFRQCPESLSIAIHGNNHNLSEFRHNAEVGPNYYNANNTNPDEKNILQALYRMDALRHKTGLSYDRVMVFPRAVFTRESLGLLKKHNFLMTVNRGVPFDKGHPTNQIDRLREISLEFENFPMVQRFALPKETANMQAILSMKNWVKMRLFLDLPVLLYTHHDFFNNGMDAFNPIANLINQESPKVVWARLGTIAKKLYMQKRNDEHEVEILSFSSDVNVENNYQTPMKFIIRKQEDFSIPIQSVQVDGVKHEYVKEANYIRIDCLIEPGSIKDIVITYNSDHQLGSFTYSDSDVKTFVIRTLSDCRDIYLSKLPFGNKLVSLFYSLGGVKNIIIVMSGVIGIFVIIILLYFKNRYSKKKIL